MPRLLLRRALALLLVPLTAHCGIDRLADRLLDSRSPRERYLGALEMAGLTKTAIFQDWSRAGERALSDAPLVTSPHREEVSLPPAEPAAIGLRVALRRGQQVRFEVDLRGDTTTVLFLEAWQIGEAADSGLESVAESDDRERSVAFEVKADAQYLFRAQPELLRGGRFSVSLVVAPTLAFPVQGGREKDIKSRWGASRDGGKRSHHGIDIFAPRGTPVLAAAAGRVEVGVNDLGGNVVWLRDGRGNNHYYAHLALHLVADGEEVKQGYPVGLVGNTGNARTTPPHLHFGIYRRGEGPVDPFWFIHEPPGPVPRVGADTTLLGGFGRVLARGGAIRTAPSTAADTLVLLTRQAPVRILAAARGWFRVRSSSGTTGFVQARLLERATDPPALGARAGGTGVATGR